LRFYRMGHRRCRMCKIRCPILDIVDWRLKGKKGEIRVFGALCLVLKGGGES